MASGATPSSRALRRRHSIGGGAPVNFSWGRWRAPVQKNWRRRRRIAAWAVKFFNFVYLFQNFFSKEFCYQGMHVEQLYFAAVCPQIRKYYYRNRPSVIKGCKTKQTEVQIPSSSKSSI